MKNLLVAVADGLRWIAEKLDPPRVSQEIETGLRAETWKILARAHAGIIRAPAKRTPS